MACKIFISTSKPNEWHQLLKGHLLKECGLNEDEVYFYPNQRAGNEISKEVVHALQEALVLMCILSDEYLESAWCVKEHFLFLKESPNLAAYAFGVMSPDLQWIEAKSAEDREKFKKETLERLEPLVGRQFPGERTQLMSHAEKSWLTSLLFSKRRRDLSKIPNLDPMHIPPSKLGFEPLFELTEQLVEDLRKAKEIRSNGIGNEDRMAIRRLCNLSAFSLAADRYRDGGWGFSLSQDFDFDTEDGDEFVHGRYDVNIIVLRALDQFLPQDSLQNEFGDALEKNVAERQPRRKASDRLPQIAMFVASLQSEGKLHDLIIKNAARIAEQLRSVPLDRRFGLDESQSDKVPSEIHILILALWQQALAYKNKVFRDELRRWDVESEKNSEAANKLRRDVESWLSQNNLFQFVLRLEGTSDIKPLTRQTLLKTATLWTVIIGSDDGVAQVSKEMFSWMRQSRISNFDKFQTAADSLIEKDRKDPSAGALGFVLCLTSAYVLHVLATENPSIPVFNDQARKLTSKLLAVLNGKEACEIMTRLNAIGWAVFLMFSRRILGSESLDATLLEELYNQGRDLRINKANFVKGQLTVEDLKNRRLQELVKNEVERIVKLYGNELAPPHQNRDELVNLLADEATFWDKRDRDVTIVTPEPSSCIAGVLRVRAVSGRVELESRGYNQLFLWPFSSITKMNVFDLLGVRRELGQDDRTLVETMGAVVVEACYVRDGDRFRLHAGGFTVRTTQITEVLRKSNLLHGLGFDDLLWVRSGPESHRWIYRSAILQPEFSSETNDAEGPTISWRFVEMPAGVEALIDISPSKVRDIAASNKESSVLSAGGERN